MAIKNVTSSLFFLFFFFGAATASAALHEIIKGRQKGSSGRVPLTLSPFALALLGSLIFI